MTHEHSDNLERELAGLTRAPAEPATLWQGALEGARGAGLGSRAARGGHWGALNRPLPMGPLGVAAAIVLLLCVGAVLLPSMGKSRSAGYVPVASEAERDGAWEGRKLTGVREGSPAPVAPAVSAPGAAAPVSERLVVRKAQIELTARDVRAAYLKAAMLLSEAQGEYIEESAISGEEPHLRGTLKLRVAAPRLSAVLGSLRELGEVTSESAGGEDVTDQVVDLEARIRNEQRVEAELLALLEARRGESLDGVLKLRDAVAQVRQNIERMTAQRERLERLVSLATVLVIIRAEGMLGQGGGGEGLGAYFLREVRESWEVGARWLADTAAWVVRVAVGGAMWWVLLMGAVVGIRQAWRRRQRALALEPAPRVG